jgi:hypothetical protein
LNLRLRERNGHEGDGVSLSADPDDVGPRRETEKGDSYDVKNERDPDHLQQPVCGKSI